MVSKFVKHILRVQSRSMEPPPSARPAFASKSSKGDIPSMIELDGSHGEGGGQILRNAVCYAAILGKDLRVQNIRARRSKPGLRAQHCTALQLVADACDGHLDGITVGSQQIVYHATSRKSERGNAGPNETTKTEQLTGSANHTNRTIFGDTQTAGSICLLLQAAVPCAMFRTNCMLPSKQGDKNDEWRWILKGGTNADMAPQYDYWEQVFWPTLLHNFSLPSNLVQARVVQRGYFPRGGGEVRLVTKRQAGSFQTEKNLRPLPALKLTERGEVCGISIRSFYAGKCPKHVAVRMAKASRTYIQSIFPNLPISEEVVKDDPAIASGSGILLVAKTTTGCRFGGSALGSPKKKESPGHVGEKAAIELCSTLADGGCVDEYLQDQLILYMALAGGTSEMITGSLTLHTQSAIWTAEKLCGVAFEVTKRDGEIGTTLTTDATTSTAEKSVDDKSKDDGRIQGLHLIRCQGLGLNCSY